MTGLRRSLRNVFLLFLSGAAILAGLMLIGQWATAPNPGADEYVRARTFLLYGREGSCTGTGVISPTTGKAYILTAAHCAVLVEGGTVNTKTETDIISVARFIDINVQKDLMLLSNPYDVGIKIAPKVTVHEHVHTITWGLGFPPYRSDGEVVISEMPWPEPFNAYATRTLASAYVLHGSSGGPLLNENNELVGIISAMLVDTHFSIEAALVDIKYFLGER